MRRRKAIRKRSNWKSKIKLNKIKIEEEQKKKNELQEELKKKKKKKKKD